MFCLIAWCVSITTENNLLNINYLKSHIDTFEPIKFLLFLFFHLLLPLSFNSIILCFLSISLALSDLPCRRDNCTLLEGINPLLLFRNPLLYDCHLFLIRLWLSCGFFSKHFLNYHDGFFRWLLRLVVSVHKFKLVLLMLKLQILGCTSCLKHAHS